MHPSVNFVETNLGIYSIFTKEEIVAPFEYVADFDDQLWQMQFDGASSGEGSGVRTVIYQCCKHHVGKYIAKGPENNLLTTYSTRGSTPCTMKICIIRCKQVRDYLVLRGNFCSNTHFCKRNFRTPAWVNNVIGVHGS
jgi:hypothetical protein